MSIDLTHDGIIDIAVGKSRKQLKWKNEQWDWSELVNKLSATERTHETVAEYSGFPKLRQDEIKDVGGFVGGYLTKGKRSASTVQYRQLVTLDIDNADIPVDEFWESFCFIFGCAAALYTTHKHSAAKPRFRLVIPLDREVFADEYVAIGRRIASKFDINIFDHTGFEPSRLMYWGSTSKDGEFEFRYKDGAWLSADEVLGEYRNWRDSSEWAVSERYEAAVKRSVKKQGDPLEKKGIVGHFCRTYNVHEVIAKYLSDVYEAYDDDGSRYTYTEGSTAGGLIIYDDTYAYSHHGTDPCSGRLCNAFDLVRLHKFGLEDAGKTGVVPDNKLPSYTMMKDLAADDEAVRLRIGRERLEDVRDDFKDVMKETAELEGSTETGQPDEYDDSWLENMKADRNGTFFASIDNIVQILENDPYIKGRLGYDEFEQCEVALCDLAWRKVNKNTKFFTDKDVAQLRHYIEKAYGISSPTKVDDALSILMQNNSFHPVRDYIKSHEWDGVKRLENLFIDYLGADDSYYSREVAKRMLVAAVMRVFNAGCKYDEMVVLVGKQGTFKSTILYKLGREWYSNSLTTVHGKEAYEQLRGVVIMEVAELSSFRKAEMNAIKHFIDKRDDRYRPSYGKRLVNFPRQLIFCGTTNDRDFLRDPTGNRRFLPVPVRKHKPAKSVIKDLTDEVVAQLWAEAYRLYMTGQEVHIPHGSELDKAAKAMQSAHSQVDDRKGAIREYLDMKFPSGWDKLPKYKKDEYIAMGDANSYELEGAEFLTKVCVPQIWCDVFGGRAKELTSQNTKPLHDIMRTMEGWVEKGRARFGEYGTQTAYVRVDDLEKVEDVAEKGVEYWT